MEQICFIPGTKNEMLNLIEVSELLSISTATARNWIRSNKIVPVGKNGRDLIFNRNDVELLLKDIKSGNENRLKSRRNKNHVSGVSIPKTYIQSKDGIEVVETIILQTSKIMLPEDYERIILAEYALKLFASEKLIGFDFNKTDSALELYLKGRIDCGKYKPLIDDLLDNINNPVEKIMILKPALCCNAKFVGNQDILGLLHMSLLCLGKRKSNGVYYTPFCVVKDAIDNLDLKGKDTKLLDPCCGSGNFLMYAYTCNNNLDGIYGYDICLLSIQLARVNMALVTKTENIDVLYKNFVCKDALRDNQRDYFDVIIGNPPWGYNFDAREEEYLKKHYITAQTKTIESFCVFIEHSINTIATGGLICLILPQSLLNVKIHQSTREFLMENCRIDRIRYWENIFDGVQCPSMALNLIKDLNGHGIKDMKVTTDSRSFHIRGERKLDQSNWHFDITDEELNVIQNIETNTQVEYLKNNASFALGIVTGDNSKYITKNNNDGYEPILRGSDVYKYKYVLSNNFIKYEPENFQQVAPTDIYRADEKLIYRFISDQLVFAYDSSKTLTLNSANLIIPKIARLKIKYILAVLNSRIIQYYFNNKFKSIKILRAHIENLPIPVLTFENQDRIISKVNKLLNANDPAEIVTIYDSIDADIKSAFDISELDYEEIVKSTSAGNNFLLSK